MGHALLLLLLLLLLLPRADTLRLPRTDALPWQSRLRLVYTGAIGPGGVGQAGGAMIV